MIDQELCNRSVWGDQYFHNMMVAVFIDWLNHETGVARLQGYTESRIEETFYHYVFLASRTPADYKRDPVRGL